MNAASVFSEEARQEVVRIFSEDWHAKTYHCTEYQGALRCAFAIAMKYDNIADLKVPPPYVIIDTLRAILPEEHPLRKEPEEYFHALDVLEEDVHEFIQCYSTNAEKTVRYFSA